MKTDAHLSRMGPHGQTIREGDKVVMWFASGNRDEQVFADPYRLDLTRYPNEHMTFGRGPHGCLGANLARLEMRIMFETLLPRLKSIELAGDVTRVRSNFVNGIKRFPVRVTLNDAPKLFPVAGPRRAVTAERDLVVTAADPVADGVVALTLSDPSGAALPEWQPGAHVDLLLAPELTRQYSLCGDPDDRAALRVAVLRTHDSRGGSAFVHERLQVGQTLRIRGPRNHFPLVPAARYRFVAGGIGITPVLTMVAQAEQAGAGWSLLYGGRSRRSMAFLDELERYGARVTIAPQDEVGLLDLDTLLAQPEPGTAVYCCGPEALLEAVEQRCASWPRGSLHVERFAARDIGPTENRAFDVVLARGERTVHVPADRSVFDVLQDAGVPVVGSCLEGVCGTCEQTVLEGELDHRDSVLSEEERAENDSMMICVSRCRSAQLTLDL